MSPSTLVISQVFMFPASTTGYPNMTGPPTVSNAVLSSSVRFDCTVRPASLASTTYTVEWSSGGVVLLSSDLTGSATVHSLDSSSLNQASRNSILDNGVSTVSLFAINSLKGDRSRAGRYVSLKKKFFEWREVKRERMGSNKRRDWRYIRSTERDQILISNKN